MSLKNFHIFFIIISIIVIAGFGVWCFVTEDGASLTGAAAMGVISLVVAVGLVVYLVKIRRKLLDNKIK